MKTALALMYITAAMTAAAILYTATEPIGRTSDPRVYIAVGAAWPVVGAFLFYDILFKDEVAQ